ncbi:serine hydrolase domain-containing protein [Roseovarius salinarum]|uniref:serine hydrolase domain-containing protein n=1 Tax=Roseovarius salinarum TaxID=1981892 RepID=UPI000C332532|nr:serine hydrolase [Roseovarius salinarum]
MRKFLAWAGRLTLLLLLAALAVGLWNRDELRRLWTVNTLFDAGRIVGNFSNMDAAFLTAPVPRGDRPVAPLPDGAAMALPEGANAWIEARAVTSLLVLHDGRIVHESYHRGTGPDDLRIGWSVSKSFLSALLGVLHEEGAITSLDTRVTAHAPALAGSAYDGASIRNVLQMASGVAFDEDYLDHDSDINRMGRVLALGGTMDGFTARLTETRAAPGADWHYVSIDTHALAMVIRGATGRGLPALMGEKIIAPLGVERAPLYLTDGEGVAFALGGLNMTTRDYARFGQMILQGGRWQGRQVVPRDWIARATRPSAPTAPDDPAYGLHWWVPGDGEAMARGVYGQYIWIDRARDVVIVTTAADRAFRDDGVHASNLAMFRRIADAL